MKTILDFLTHLGCRVWYGQHFYRKYGEDTNRHGQRVELLMCGKCYHIVEVEIVI